MFLLQTHRHSSSSRHSYFPAHFLDFPHSYHFGAHFFDFQWPKSAFLCLMAFSGYQSQQFYANDNLKMQRNWGPQEQPSHKGEMYKIPTHSSFSSPHRFWELPSKTEFSYTQWKFLIASYIWVTFFSCFAFPLPIVVSRNYLQNKLFEVKSLFQGLLLGKVEQWHIYSQT